MNRSDEELIAAYVGGEEGAFAQLVERHLKGVYSFVFRFVGNEHEAEDISQETFLKAWRNIKKYDPHTSKFKTWLMRIARNTSIDHLRKKKHIAFSEFDTTEDENILAQTLSDPGELPEVLLARADDIKELERGLELIPPPARELLLLYYGSDLTFEEIGHITGQNPNTIKSRHRRALQSLRTVLHQNTEK